MLKVLKGSVTNINGKKATIRSKLVQTEPLEEHLDKEFEFSIPSIYRLEDDYIIGFKVGDEIGASIFVTEDKSSTFFVTSQFEDQVFYVLFSLEGDEYIIKEQKLVPRDYADDTELCRD